jgi:hypothetical protein
VANALAAATGLRFTSLPITAEKIVRGLGDIPRDGHADRPAPHMMLSSDPLD